MKIKQPTFNSGHATPKSVGRPRSLGVLRSLLNAGCSQNKSSEKGSVLIVVLWIVIGLVAITLYFANAMTLELRASDNRMNGQAADQAIEGAARYVGYALANYATNGTMPTNAQFTCEAVAIGDAHFWIIGRDPSGTVATEPTFGLVDEAGKLNLNRVNTNTLSYLPNMTTDLAAAIVDWRGTNGTGTYALNYSTLGYEDKNAPFESVDELRLVYGMTIDVLAGDDGNRNGVLDGGEKSSTGGATPNFGLLDYTTVFSREPNFHADGTTMTNVNTLTSAANMYSFFQAAGLSSGETVATAIYDTMHPQRPPGAPANLCKSPFDFCLRCLSNGMAADDFAKLYNIATTTTNLYTYGRVNINTAGVDVLTALLMGANVDQDTAVGAAQSLVAYREQNPTSLNSPAWMATALGQNNGILGKLAAHDWITAKSYQFTADIAAVGPLGRGYRRVKFVFDMSDGTPKIIYRQDLSRLGWALGEKARANLIAKNTP
jgi:type II secretory pathway component PulK